jgi:hypothetical protein
VANQLLALSEYLVNALVNDLVIVLVNVLVNVSNNIARSDLVEVARSWRTSSLHFLNIW